jgi:hypothetical protein
LDKTKANINMEYLGDTSPEILTALCSTLSNINPHYNSIGQTLKNLCIEKRISVMAEGELVPGQPSNFTRIVIEGEPEPAA